jgi:predicted ArsR family transcriptional regulator
MSEYRTEAVDPQAHRALADVSRVAVLETLRQAGRPLAIPEIAAQVGLHPNTVRGHLALLAEHGYVIGEQETRDRPGRPRLLYRATGKLDDGDRRNYRLLAEALIAYLKGHDTERARAAVTAGRAYGERAVHRDPHVTLDAAAAIQQVVDLLTDIGFEPTAAADGSRIDLRRCPFRELAEADPDVVCAVHLGIMQGALAELGAPVEATGLQPFVTPDRCVVTLARAASGALDE